MIGHGIDRWLMRNILKVAQCSFLEEKHSFRLPANLFLDTCQSLDQVFFCLSSASFSRALTEPAAFDMFTSFLNLPDTAFETEPRHLVAF